MSTRKDSMKGKIVVVTGATSGIGQATALGLADLGAQVVVVGRNEQKGKKALEAIREATAREVDFLHSDLSSQAQVRELAETISERYPRVDVLINNAGVITRERSLTVDGIETQLAVNHLAPFLLTSLLLDRLKSSAPSRVIVVASQVESMGKIHFEDLGFAQGYDSLQAYYQSKLANVLFTLELARRLKGGQVTANCLHPGVIATQLLDDYIGRPRALNFLNRWKNPPPREGARTSLYLASSSEVAEVTGKYFSDRAEAEPSPQARDPELASKLWDVSARLVGLV